jgi:hypothetical protein
MLVRGTPAVHARGLARRALSRLLQLTGVLVLSVILSWATFGTSFFAPVLVLAVPCSLVVVLGIRRFNVEYLKASTGVRAEDRVARTLVRLPLHAVVHGAVIDRGDLDHVVFGPQLAVLETKHGRGPLAIDRDGTLRVGSRRLPRDPIAQARGNASRLSARLGRHVDAVVVIVDATSPPLQAGGVWVCSLTDLPRVLSALPNRLDAQTAETLARSLPVAG